MNTYPYVYIDESGEFGLKPESSDHLIIAVLKCANERDIERVARRVWRDSGLGKTRAEEIHATDASDKIRYKLLDALAQKKIAIDLYVYQKPRQHLEDVHVIYYEMLQEVLRNNSNAYKITIDRRDTVKKRNAMIALMTHSHLFERVDFEDSRRTKQLQVVDMVSWSAYQDIELGIGKYLERLSGVAIHRMKWPPV